MNILGLNAFHGDASAALVKDGELVAAIEEERLNRRKHCAGFPGLAAKSVLSGSGVAPTELDHVAISRDPKANLHKKVLFALQKRPSFTKLVKDRLANVAKVRSVDDTLAEALGVSAKQLKAKFHNVEHHKSHLASAFFVSPFEEAACLSIDGFGDFASNMRAVGRGLDIEILDRVEFPHSAGIFYTAITQFLGFHKYGEEWKMMGLAPYGKPTYVEKLRQVIRPLDGGRFELDLDYFRHHSEGVEMTWDDGSPQMGLVFSPKLADLLGPARDPEDPEFFGKWADIAHSTQVVFEEIFFHVLTDLHHRTGLTRLALAGGCALNSVANGKIFERTPFREVFVQPAAGDNGTAIGAAFFVEHSVLRRPRNFVMRHAYTGPSFTDGEIEAAIERARGNGWDPTIGVRRLEDADLYREVVGAITGGKVVGWFQGKMEFGPRALGNRSIVADPRRADMKDILNTRIKHRETYRPFAPSILEEKVADVFERSEPSPFMLMVYKVKEDMRARLPAITHVDNTGRLQSVSAATNPRYHALISEFHRQTGIPLVLNTSFNEHEPIVTTPTEAINCYLKTRMDVLALGNWVLTRASA
ncbi:MAG TPA: carbamoyltransferase C-terminal domain-containing protein [Polyangia bacterium]|jgi:carbamoyltransferase|nr:carbamoyltransferase C-terminal domain-containing protein [Polyangia bacterium]